MAASTEQPCTALREADALQVRVRILPDRPIEHARVDGAWNDVNGNGDSPVEPIVAQPLAEDDEAVATVVHVREEVLVRPPEGKEASLEGLVLGEPLGEEGLVCRGKVRRVDAQKRHSFRLAQPNSELEQHRGRLREANVEVPSLRIENPRSERHGQAQPGIRLDGDAGQAHRLGCQLVRRGVRVFRADHGDFVTAAS